MDAVVSCQGEPVGVKREEVVVPEGREECVVLVNAGLFLCVLILL